MLCLPLMIGQFLNGKTAVFIDGANVFYAQRSLGWKVDFKKLAEYLQRETKIVELRYYTGKVGTLEKQLAFIQMLESFGYTVTAKEVKFIKVGEALIPKGNLDVELALDAFRLQDRFDTCVLFSGDSDFAYLLDLLKQNNKKVLVASTRNHVARELLERAKYIELKKLRATLQIVKGTGYPAP